MIFHLEIYYIIDKMPETLRVSARTPDGKTHYTTYSLRYYTREEAEKKAEEWKASVRAGVVPKRVYPGEVARSDNSEPYNKKLNGKGIDASLQSEPKTESEPTKDPVLENVNLERKDFKSIQLPDEGGASFLFLGSTRSGKTTFIKAVHKHFFEDDISVLHTCSPAAKIYGDLKKECALAPSFCKEVIDECMKINQRTNNKYRFTHIIDDCVSSKNDNMMIKLLTIGRNSYQSTLISGQELSILNAIGRSNINYVFLGKLGSDMAVEKVVKQYLLSYFPSDMSLPDKIKLYWKLTANYNWIVLDMIEAQAFLTKLNM